MINNTEQETISIIQLTQQSSLAYQKVLAYVKDQNFVKANEYLIKGNETLLEASKIHAGCLTVSSDLDLLLVHTEKRNVEKNGESGLRGKAIRKLGRGGNARAR